MEKLIGIGNSAEVYEYGEKYVCKLFNPGYPMKSIQKEFGNMKLVNSFGIASSKAVELIDAEGRTGIIEEKIEGETILKPFTRGENIPELLRGMVELQKKILACHSTDCISYKDSLRNFISGKVPADDPIYERISALPVGDCICHGDYHPDNVFKNAEGELIVVDFMNICYGPREYDIARTFFLMSQGKLPKDLSASEQKRLKGIQKSLGEDYLSMMDMNIKDIEPFLTVVTETRVYEMM